MERVISGSLRSRLLLVVGAASLALLLSLIGSAFSSARQARELRDIEQRLVPKLELGPKLQAEFEQLRQAMQDAVAAQDLVALEATLDRRNRMFDLAGSARNVIDANDAALLRWTVHDYYETARSVSRRLIAADTGEALVEDMARMQALQVKVEALIKRTTGLSRGELSRSFTAIGEASERGDRLRIGIGIAGLVLVLALSFSASTSVLRALRRVSNGLSRFATGDFKEPIPTAGFEELSNLAREANQMAADLQRLAEQRNRLDWLREGQVALANEMRGDVDPSALANRVVRCLAARTSAVAGALYLLDGARLELRGQYALNGPDPLSTRGAATASGSGLVREAMRAERFFVVDEVPANYLTVESGLGQSAPLTLVFLPLARFGESVGVLELALFKRDIDDVRELLSAVQEMLVVGVQAAQSRAALKRALEQTQLQAERLTTQEEELRSNNSELQAQHEELRVANSELEEQRAVLSQKNDEVEEARRRLQQKADELSKMSAYKSQFLANMSHELRTPLNSMLLLSHLLSQNEAGALSSKQVDYAKTIHSAGGDLLSLINQVLDLAKIEAGKQDLQVETVELQRFADYARRVFEPLAEEKGLALRIELAPDLPREINTDPLRVERIVTNLIGNAIKFTERGQVTLRIARPAPGTPLRRTDLDASACIALSVSDTGIGIALHAQERVFAPFEQIDSHSTRRYGGTGLGLAISRESASLLGGELRLESEPGEGSTFTCYLPLQPARRVRATSDQHRSDLVVADDRRELPAGAPCLLVIEDDPVLAEQLVDIIHSRRLKALVASTGEEGIRLAVEHRPQGVILDVTLPDIDGWTVMERLRSHPATRETPVHFVSGVDSPDRGLALGAIGYLMKPASHSELALAIRALVPSSSHGVRSVLVVEDSAVEGDSLCELLRKEGFDALRVGSARAALDTLERSRFGCMILDLGLPDMDGLAVLETLRARNAADAPRVIVHTGRALNKRETQQLEAYAEAVVLKEGDSATRLLEEIRLFVSHVRDTLTPQARTQLPPAPLGIELSFASKTILLAEDDMRTVYALTALLTSKGATVLVADTGKEALELLDQTPSVDAVLMDIMMPEMDGYEATRRLRTDHRFSTLPVIALTARAMKGEQDRCLEAGATDYLTKPIDTERLLRTLHDHLQRGGDASVS